MIATIGNQGKRSRLRPVSADVGRVGHGQEEFGADQTPIVAALPTRRVGAGLFVGSVAVGQAFGGRRVAVVLVGRKEDQRGSLFSLVPPEELPGRVARRARGRRG